MPIIQDTPNIPAELYREIVEQLDYLDDRSTLLSLAVVDRAWGDESRRVMYRGLVDHAEKSNDHQRTMRTHTLFLKSVISTPLLALYVQIYDQDQLSIDPDESQATPESEPLVDLWHLTRKALPLMLNLKHLLFICRGAAGPRTSQTLLSQCQFRLQSLSWEYGRSDDLQHNFIPFLRTQTTLSHLEVGDSEMLAEYCDLSWLPGNVCLNLVSASCQMSSMAQIMQNRRIKALRLDTDLGDQSLPNHSIVATMQLQYLSVWDLSSFCKFVGPVDLNIQVLELLSWDEEDIMTLPYFPALRVLSFLDFDSDERDPILRRRLVRQCLRKCPKLECVLIQDNQPDAPQPCHFTMFSLKRTSEASIMDPGVEVDEKEIYIGRPLGIMWWTVYSQQSYRNYSYKLRGD